MLPIGRMSPIGAGIGVALCGFTAPIGDLGGPAALPAQPLRVVPRRGAAGPRPVVPLWTMVLAGTATTSATASCSTWPVGSASARLWGGFQPSAEPLASPLRRERMTTATVEKMRLYGCAGRAGEARASTRA